ncbi:NUMOD1 domain-containing DNA-binding protein [Seonamhaeicola marinus]|uniref:Endonuclease n=1 Tax=Seonamhaeicola marinus TaxID=1912246 RepID=A0A5D0HSH6_9FLAO|nr:NUMOD1 domain-containing DNA-binding protein [Seonamhaeicola marinus]TYA74238.1 endonuclease [Seonamhaeicola marinus]
MKKDNNQKAGIIYTVECKITGQYYVGATTDSLHQRKLDHEERANRGETHFFAQAIATYGSDAFHWKQVDTAESLDELARKEVEYIEKLNANNGGFNANKGGGIKKTVFQYDANTGAMINHYNSLKEAAFAVGASKTSISNACLGQTKTCKGYYWSYELPEKFNPLKDLRKKVVEQFSLSGNLITVYKSVAEASRETGISKTCISRVCRNEREHSGGFIWRYK